MDSFRTKLGRATSCPEGPNGLLDSIFLGLLGDY